jgi:hypothetical protein
MVMFDYTSNTFRYNSRSIDLDILRVWMMEMYPEIVLAHRIRKIYREGSWEWSFDWDTVFFKISNNIIHEFIKYYDQDRNK